MLSVRNLRKTYHMGDSTIGVLENLNLTIEKGEFVSIVGASGTGKSTLLHLMGGLDRPDEGEVTLAGESLFEGDEARIAERRNRSIGFVFQFHHLLPEFTALENVAMPRRIAGKSEADSREHAKARLTEVGLAERLEHLPTQLSGGERQRVAFARALANEPEALLMDEPTGNLDPKSAEGLFDLVADLQKRKSLTILMVTHNMDLAARTDRILVLRDGSLVQAE